MVTMTKIPLGGGTCRLANWITDTVPQLALEHLVESTASLSFGFLSTVLGQWRGLRVRGTDNIRCLAGWRRGGMQGARQWALCLPPRVPPLRAIWPRPMDQSQGKKVEGTFLAPMCSWLQLAEGDAKHRCSTGNGRT